MVTTSTAVLAGGPTLSIAVQGRPGAPAVVFLPGPTDSWLSYRPVLDCMPESVHCVAVSQRGHGDSSKPPAGYRVADFAADVPALLDALEVSSAVLVGHSASCLVARRVAIDNPDRVSGLVLEASPVTLAGHAGFVDLVTNVVSRLEDPIDREFVRSFVTGTSSAGLAIEFEQALVGEALKVPARVWRAMFGDLAHYDDRDDLPSLRAPTLLIWGDADPLVGRHEQEQLVECLAAANLVTYRGLGHTPRWDDPGRFAADVAAFTLAA